jgi:hypothetical protein
MITMQKPMAASDALQAPLARLRSSLDVASDGLAEMTTEVLRWFVRELMALQYRLRGIALPPVQLRSIARRLAALRARIDRLAPAPAMAQAIRAANPVRLLHATWNDNPLPIVALCTLVVVLSLVIACSYPSRKAKRRWKGSVCVFYDVEHGPLPTKGLVLAIRALALSLGDRVDRMYGYMELSSSPRALLMRRMLLENGCTLIDTPHNGIKETADKVMIFDMADCAARRRADVILLVTDDADFCIPVSRVQQSGIPVARAGFQRSVAELIRSDRSFNWEDGDFIEVIDAPFRIRRKRERKTSVRIMGVHCRAEASRQTSAASAKPAKHSHRPIATCAPDWLLRRNSIVHEVQQH